MDKLGGKVEGVNQALFPDTGSSRCVQHPYLVIRYVYISSTSSSFSHGRETSNPNLPSLFSNHAKTTVHNNSGRGLKVLLPQSLLLLTRRHECLLSWEFQLNGSSRLTSGTATRALHGTHRILRRSVVGKPGVAVVVAVVVVVVGGKEHVCDGRFPLSMTIFTRTCFSYHGRFPPSNGLGHPLSTVNQ